MKRLIGRDESGHAYIIGCPAFELPEEANALIQSVVDKCAIIEDALGEDYDLERITDIIEADRDGRCVIFKSGFPVASYYYREDGLDIREVSGVVSREEYEKSIRIPDGLSPEAKKLYHDILTGECILGESDG